MLRRLTATVFGWWPAATTGTPTTGPTTTPPARIRLEAVHWLSISYPVSCGGQTTGTAVAYPSPQGVLLAVVLVTCVHGAGSPPSAVLVFDYATSPTQPHLLETLVTYQDGWNPQTGGSPGAAATWPSGSTATAPACPVAA